MDNLRAQGGISCASIVLPSTVNSLSVVIESEEGRGAIDRISIK